MRLEAEAEALEQVGEVVASDPEAVRALSIVTGVFFELMRCHRTRGVSTILWTSNFCARFGIDLRIQELRTYWVIEMGSFVHACEGEMVCESVNPKIPYFNAPIYLENKV